MTDLPTPSAAPAAEWLSAPTLKGRGLTLEALTRAHAADLQAGATEDTIRFLARGGPTAHTVPAWADYIDRLNALPRRVNFAVRLHPTGTVVGRISYSEVRPDDRWVEIGTMLLPMAQGTAVNPEAKRLLLTRAFEELGAGRVHFKVDARNERSLRAMRRLGAVQEGVLRAYQVRPDGQARDSVMFSILAHEWPVVRAGLDARLNTLLTFTAAPTSS